MNLKCEMCELSHPEDEVRDVGGHLICDECYDDDTYYCQRCDRLHHHVLEPATRYRDHWYCPSCSLEIFCTCDVCNATIVRNNSRMYEDETYCTSCFRIRYRECCSCRGIFPTDDTVYDSSSDRRYCNHCYVERSALRGWDYRPDFQYMRVSVEDRFFMGMELEVDKEDSEDGYDKRTTAVAVCALDLPVYCKTDGSLDYGFEVVSHPATLEYHTDKMGWKKITKVCRNHGFRSNDVDTCGIHVHVTKSWFGGETNLVKLSAFVHTHRIENIKVARRDNSYAKYKEVKGALKASIHVCDRYEAINYTNDDTVEFRMFKGTLRTSTIISYLQYVHSVCHFIKQVSIATILQPSRGWEAYLDYVKANKSTYKELIAYLHVRKLLPRSNKSEGSK